MNSQCIPTQSTSSPAQYSDVPPTPSTVSATNSATSLVGVAGKCFSIMSELSKNPHPRDTQQLKNYLTKEIQEFSQQTKALGHNDETILLSQFILSKSFDSLVLSTAWGIQGQWQPLLKTLPHASSLDNNFIMALKKMCELPELFIDLLELVYICISLSDVKDNHNQPLQRFSKTLYEIIQQQRGEFEKKLSKNPQKIPVKSGIRFNKKTLFMTTLASLLIILGLYASFNYLLTQASSPIEQQVNILTKQANTPQR